VVWVAGGTARAAVAECEAAGETEHGGGGGRRRVSLFNDSRAARVAGWRSDLVRFGWIGSDPCPSPGRRD
jgi:hypothetical protein